MKFLINALPGTTPIPPEQGANLLQAAFDWTKAKLADGSLEFVYNLFGGGGFGVGLAESHEEVLSMLLDYPLYPFFSWEVTPLLDLESSINQYIGYYKKISSM